MRRAHPCPRPSGIARERRTVKFAYADPPYPGHTKRKLYANDPQCAEVDHAELVARLVRDFPDGWALSTYPGSGAVSAAWLYRFPPMEEESA